MIICAFVDCLTYRRILVSVLKGRIRGPVGTFPGENIAVDLLEEGGEGFRDPPPNALTLLVVPENLEAVHIR